MSAVTGSVSGWLNGCFRLFFAQVHDKIAGSSVHWFERTGFGRSFPRCQRQRILDFLVSSLRWRFEDMEKVYLNVPVKTLHFWSFLLALFSSDFMGPWSRIEILACYLSLYKNDWFLFSGSKKTKGCFELRQIQLCFQFGIDCRHNHPRACFAHSGNYKGIVPPCDPG